MTWISYIFPQTIFRTSSRYNRDIRVIKEHGEYKLLVNGSRQSGNYIRKLWGKAFAAFGLGSDLFGFQGLTLSEQKILILGVAGGTVIHLLQQMYPKVTIVGVDIDEVMLDIGRTYFGLKEPDLVTLVHEDARKYIHRSVRQKKKYDLIIIDLFFGREIPRFVSSQPFLRQVRRMLKKHGTVVINYLRELEYGERSDALMKTLTKVFPEVKDFSIYHNRFFAVK